MLFGIQVNYCCGKHNVLLLLLILLLEVNRLINIVTNTIRDIWINVQVHRIVHFMVRAVLVGK